MRMMHKKRKGYIDSISGAAGRPRLTFLLFLLSWYGLSNACFCIALSSPVTTSMDSEAPSGAICTPTGWD